MSGRRSTRVLRGEWTKDSLIYFPVQLFFCCSATIDINLSIPTLQPMPYSQRKKETEKEKKEKKENKKIPRIHQMAGPNQLRTKIHAEGSSNGVCEPASDFF